MFLHLRLPFLFLRNLVDECAQVAGLTRENNHTLSPISARARESPSATHPSEIKAYRHGFQALGIISDDDRCVSRDPRFGNIGFRKV